MTNAFGVDHEPISKGMGSAWKLGSAMRGNRKLTTGVYQTERAKGANVGAARETALNTMAPRANELGAQFKAQSTTEKGVSLASTYSRPIGATAAVGAGGVGAYKYGQKRSR